MKSPLLVLYIMQMSHICSTHSAYPRRTEVLWQCLSAAVDRLHDVVKGFLDKLQVRSIAIAEALEIVHGSQ